MTVHRVKEFENNLITEKHSTKCGGGPVRTTRKRSFPDTLDRLVVWAASSSFSDFLPVIFKGGRQHFSKADISVFFSHENASGRQPPLKMTSAVYVVIISFVWVH